MNTPQNAAGSPAAAPSRVSASQIGLLIEVPVLAMQDSRQQFAVKKAHREYIDSLNDFAGRYGRVEGRVNPKNADHAEIVPATKAQYEAGEREKRIAYNLRHWLQTACRRAVSINAESAL